jgi:hypothetical protein
MGAFFQLDFRLINSIHKKRRELSACRRFFDFQVGLVAALHLADVVSHSHRSFVPGAKFACDQLNHKTAGFPRVLAPDSATVVEDR